MSTKKMEYRLLNNRQKVVVISKICHSGYDNIEAVFKITIQAKALVFILLKVLIAYSYKIVGIPNSFFELDINFI